MGHPDLFQGQGELEALGDEEADKVDYAVAVAPLVVVPAQHFDAVADDFGQRGVDDRGELVAL